MRRAFALGFGLGVALAGTAWAEGASGFDGQYRGELILTSTIKGDCTPPPLGALYPLTIAQGRVRFAYVPRFGTALAGVVDSHGDFKASARLRHGVIVMTGHIEGRNVSAAIISPSCRYSFQTQD